MTYPIFPLPADEADHILRAAIEFANIGIFRYKMDGTILFIDRGAMRIFSLEDKYSSPENLTGKNISDLIIYIRPVKSLRKEIELNLHVTDLEYPFRTLDGVEKWVLHNSYLVADARSGEKAVQAIIQDITARKKAEKIQNSVYGISEATLNADNLNELFSAIHVTIQQLMPSDNFYIALIDKVTGLLSFPYFVDKFDQPPTPRMPGKGVTEYVLRNQKSLLATPKIIEDLLNLGEIESLGADSIDWLGVPLVSKGETIGVLAVQSYNEDYRYTQGDREILEFVSTQIAMAIERKKFEDAKRESEELFASFMDFLPATAYVKDQQGQFLYTNQFMHDLYGITNWLGKNTKELISENSEGAILGDDQLSIHSGLNVRLEQITDAAGNQRFFQTYKFPIKREGKASLLGGIAIDITQRTQAEAHVQKQISRLEALRTIDLAISGSVDIKVILDILVDQVIMKLNVDSSDVMVLNNKTKVLEFIAGKGLFSSRRKHLRLRIGEDLAGQAALRRATISIPNLSGQDITNASTQLLYNQGVCAYFAVPLIAKGQIKGILEIFHHESLSPNEEWLDFMQALGMQAAIAISDAELYDDLQRTNTELIVAFDDTIEGWARALEIRDLEPAGHTRRVTDLTERLAGRFGFSQEAMVHLRRGAILHDIGKMAIPEAILLKTSTLSADETDIIRQHPGYAYKLLSQIPFIRPALEIPLCHHEKWDGTGYPRGLKGEDIPLAARIFAVVDVWDAMCSDRPYRVAWPEDTALRHILAESGKHFDPQVIDQFIQSRREA